MDHSIELQLNDFDFPFLLTFPHFLIKEHNILNSWNTILPPSIGLFRGKDHIVFNAHHLLSNSEYEPNGIIGKTHAHLQDGTASELVLELKTKQSMMSGEERLLLAGLT